MKENQNNFSHEFYVSDLVTVQPTTHKSLHMTERSQRVSEKLKIQALTRLYRNMYENNVTSSGGVQQYLNNLNVQDIEIVPNDGIGSHVMAVTFSSLPTYVKLEIFSYLSPRELCGIMTVSREWSTLAGDDVLWKKMMQHDSKNWHVIGWDSNPHMYTTLQSDWSQQQIYLQCCPSQRESRSKTTSLYAGLSFLLRSLLPRKPPRIAMFGPGIESSNSSRIVRKILGDNGLFSVVKLFPGLFDGLGSGFTIKVDNRDTLDLMVLYSSTHRDRTTTPAKNRMARSRLFQHRDDNTENGGYELTQSVADLCHSLDAFIYVIDGNVNAERHSNCDLMAMCHERWSSLHLPVLVLSVAESNTPRIPAVDLVQSLDLTSLNRPWQIHDVRVSNLSRVAEAFHWLTRAR